jgi:2-oxoglutarate ferredoxin oxidoreductase subunit alpha
MTDQEISYNDFVIKFANVNGSGSASANGMFAKALFRMGVPVAGRNIFPSNIQGLPTWFEVRVNEQGYLGRREGVDIMVAMNAETYAQDVAEVVPGGYLIYDNSKPLDRALYRADIVEIGIPIATLLLPEFDDAKQRQLFKNILYVGALSALINIDIDVLTGMISAQYQGKDALIKPNIHALELGRRYALEYLDGPLPIQVRPSTAAKGKIMIDGNTAAGLGCIYGGATVCAWYPITPSTSVAEAFEKYANRLRIDKDTGSEFLGLAYFAEIPAVLIDVQRSGPSTGMPTRTQQSDLISAVYASHGDTKHVVLLPSTPRECFDFAADALDLADRLQTPVIVLTDLDLGMNDGLSEPMIWDDERRYDRGKVYTAEDLDQLESFGRYRDVDGDGIGYRTYPGTHPQKGSFFTRGTSRDADAIYSESPAVYVENMDRLLRKWDTASQLVPAPVITSTGKPHGIIYYGTTHGPMEEALDALAQEGIHLDAMRLRAVPFSKEVFEFIEAHDVCFVAEQNRDAQMKKVLVAEGELNPASLVAVLYFGGLSLSASAIVDQVREYFEVNRLPRLSEVKT